MIVQTHTGSQLTLGQEINRGGEARIWSVQRDAQQLAKLYFTPTPQHEAKLHAMLANPPRQPRDHTAIAWPTEILYQNGRFVGFLMPRVYDCNSIFRVYNPMLRAKLPELYPWTAFLHRTARNLAAAVELVHARGHVVGDLNESNILVTRDARVTLVDADSFQVRAEQNALHHCTVAKAEFMPPELYDTDLKSVARTVEQDHFGLAVLIWYLLMEGFHPFQGVLQHGQPVESVHLHCMRRGLFPYQHYSVAPPPKARPLEQLHPVLAQAFYDSFVSGHGHPAKRPSANAWQHLLTQAEDALVACPENKSHYYYGQLQRCPLCHPLSRRQSMSQRAYGVAVKVQQQLGQPWPELSTVRNTKQLTEKARATMGQGAERLAGVRALPQQTRRTWQRLRPPLAFGTQWTAINVAGAGGSALLAGGLWLVLTAWLGMSAMATPLLLGGMLFGALLGNAQWPMLLPHAPKQSMSRLAWVATSGAAGLVATTSGTSSFAESTVYRLNELGLGDVRPLLIGLLLGALLGLGQWLLLHYQLRRKIEGRAWIMSSVTGWGLAGLGWLAGSQWATEWQPIPPDARALVGPILGGLIGVALYGLFTSRWLYSGLQKASRTRHAMHRHSWRFGAGFRVGMRPRFLGNLPKEIKRWGWDILLLLLVLSILQKVLVQL